MAERTANTIEEYMPKVMKLISDMKLADAQQNGGDNLDKIIDLETKFLEWVQGFGEEMVAGLMGGGGDMGMGGMGGDPMMGGGGGMGGMAPPPPSPAGVGVAPQGGGGVPGVPPQMSAPDPDSVRRLLSQ